MDLGSDQRLQHLVQLLVKGSEEISLEFHSELIPDPLVAIVHYAEPMDLGSGMINNLT